jgi:hypothetical protein
MSSNPSSNNTNRRKRGVDSLLTTAGKSLSVGETCSFRLIKGPPTQSTKDPVDPKAPPQIFPVVAKFPESVVRPDFSCKPWQDGRLYQQDIPKPAADSDEEDIIQKQKKKRWKYNQKPPARQWILQEQVDFLETMVARREKRASSLKIISSRYEGVPEHNASNYVLLMGSSSNSKNQLQVRTLPTPQGTIPFAQPASRQSYSLNEAEQAIQDQRSGIRMLRQDGNGQQQQQGPRRIKPAKSSKNRLEQKLNKTTAGLDNGEEDGDDVMGDITYKNRKGGGGAARRELLSSLGDGVAVSTEGVMGGTNDAAFGGRNRFGQLHVEAVKSDSKAAEGPSEPNERGADGAAMSDDFYQRDVKAEYDELDYDANEQFDDDDVDLGESEMVGDSAGFGGGDEDEEEDFEELDMEEETLSGAEGLATAAGFKAMLAKARGDAPIVAADGTEAATGGANHNQNNALDKKDRDEEASEEEGGDHMAKIMAAAEKSAAAATNKSGQPPPAVADTAKSTAASAIQVDADGLRIISLEAVRREIWLNHGSIPMKRLMRMFQVKRKSSQERQGKFRDVVKELCTMKSDPVAGRMLVLKQHYANMS